MSTEAIIIDANDPAADRTLTAIDAIATKLDTMEWKYTRTEKKVEFRFPSKPFTGHCVARVHDDRHLLILVTLGLFIPEQGRLAVRILMNRLNWQLLLGNLEMDDEDGEVRLRYTYPLIGGNLDGERAVRAIMQLCSIARDAAPDLLQASATTDKDSAGTTIQ